MEDCKIPAFLCVEWISLKFYPEITQHLISLCCQDPPQPVDSLTSSHIYKDYIFFPISPDFLLSG